MNRICQILVFLVLSMSAIVVNAQTASVAPADSATLKDYVGTYSFASGAPVEKFTVTIENGSLYGKADNMDKSKLVKQAKDDTFQSTSSYAAIITFLRDAASKAVTGFSMAVQGTELTGTKDKP